ncbi:MAG: HNH endonuclease [Succinivibrio sp.]
MKDGNYDFYVLEAYFRAYNRDFKQLSMSSINHYCEAIKKISLILRASHMVEESLYEITDLNELDIIRSFLDKNTEYKELDERGHRMYSCGFKKYYEFASSDAFEGIGRDISAFDPLSSEIDVPPRVVGRNVSSYARSSIVKKQVIQAAQYQCEISKAHESFIAQSTKHQYMEAHHLIALKHQDEFKKNLDVYSNVICLCPICHRLLHYGIDSERKPLLNYIYSNRGERLRQSGIILTKGDFLDLTLSR